MKHVKLFEQYINEWYDDEDEDEVSKMTWQEAVADAISQFEADHRGGIEKVAALIEEGDEDAVFKDELYADASVAVADPAAYLGIRLSDKENDALEEISNGDQKTWLQMIKVAFENTEYTKEWMAVAKFIAENGF